ncbi:glutamate--tRNA ligase [Candidatus Parcubacteria bacterium]|nr:glutamate--tRNA ligase [Candidatus Parcubacteria bacterium]
MVGRKTEVITRFPPSPTGLLHVGNYRTALFNYLFARQNDGKMFLRIEDTDRERSTKEFEDNIHESLAWLGIPFEKSFRQSERVDIHRNYLKKLIDSGKAYISKEEKDGKVSELVRFKNPNIRIVFDDLIRGKVAIDTTDLKDFIIAKNINEPLYHLAVVVDDFEMKVTHVIRGEDHISNTPRQILIGDALGAPRPFYAHLPLVLAPDRSKLSKRAGAKAVTEYRDMGFLPEAIINYMALLGWNPGTEQEIFGIDQLVKNFQIEKIHKSGAIFDETKLRWMNREYLRRLPQDVLVDKIMERFIGVGDVIVPQNLRIVLVKMLPLLLDRIETFGDVTALIKNGELDYFFARPEVVPKLLVWKDDTVANVQKHLKKIISLISNISAESFTGDQVKEVVWPYATEMGKGNVLWPMRVALSGRDKSPDPFEISGVLGKQETIARLEKAAHL